MPLFSRETLKMQIPQINKNFIFFMDENSKKMEEQSFDMKTLSSKFTLNTIVWTMIGIENQVLSDDELMETVENTNEFLKSGSERFFNAFLHPDFMFKLTGKYQKRMNHLKKIWKIVEKNFLDQSYKKFQEISFFECMKNHHSIMSKEEFIESCYLFIIASFETTAVTISAILFLLASNPEKQEKLFDEIFSILASNEDEVTVEKMNEMTYLDLVIKESLRMIPVTLGSARKLTDDVEFSKL